MKAALRTWLILASAALLSACATGSRVDPPSGIIDPPPAPADYVGAFPANQWVFGHLLWQDRNPCDAQSCEAAYNAAQVYVLVSREHNCCGDSGYSITIQANVAQCSGVSYYLAWSKDLERLKRPERLAFLARHVAGVVAGMRSACHVAGGEPVPTAALARLLY